MASSTSFLVVLLLLHVSLTAGKPENQGSTVFAMDVNTTSDGWLLDSVKSVLDNVQRHLTSLWQHAAGAPALSLVKRDVTAEKPENITANISSTEQPEHYFEEYEKMYLVNQTMNMLEQMLVYAEYEASLKNNYSNTNATVGNRAATEFQRRELSRLNAMSPNQLRQLLRNVTFAAQKGYVAPRISSTCCQIG